MNNTPQITRIPVPGNLRLGCLPFVFGQYALSFESLTFAWMRRLNTHYSGGHWGFCNLSNGGFYMATECNEAQLISSPNGYEARVSADAAGVIASLYALNALANSTEDDLIITKFYELRDFAKIHPENEAIFAAIDRTMKKSPY